MRYYIASSGERADDLHRVRDLLAVRGHELTYDPTAHEEPRGSFGRLAEAAATIAQAVLDADVLIALLPGGRGTHVEIGMALAARRRVVLHAYDPAAFGLGLETCAFYHHPLAWSLTASFEQLVEHLCEFVAPRSPTADRWCIVSDDDGHRYLVPLDQRDAAIAQYRDQATYRDMTPEERAPYVRPSGPDRAVRLEGGVLSFTDPQVDGRRP